MRRSQRGSYLPACSALLTALVALSLAPGPARAAVDDQNLTGLVYLSDGTPLSATLWADNTSLAVYVNHGGDWATAWRYPASGWYLTSGGAYSIVLPAAEKDVSWGNGDPYRVTFDVSAITGTPGRTDNATSHGTGDPGEYSPVGSTENAIVWNATDNWQRWDVVLLALPDLAVDPADVVVTPPGPVADGTVVTIDATVRNLGTRDAADAAVRFTDGVPPGTPIGSDQVVPLLLGGGSAVVSVPWTASPPGLHTVCAAADPDGLVEETDEANNVGCVDVTVVSPPQTRPDYAPVLPQPPTPIRAGLSQPLSLSIEVRNGGNATASTVSTLAFFNETTPAAPFATFPVPPLAPSETSARFTAPWISPATPGTLRVIADGDHENDLAEWDEANNAFAWTVTVVSGPVTNLVVGAPNYTAAETYVTSATPLSFSVLDQSGAGIRSTTYRVALSPWVNYTATGPFTLAGEGPHVVEWSSEDFAGNVEGVSSATLIVDDTPPTTTLTIGEPKYLVGGTFVNGTTPIALVPADGGATPVGLGPMSFRVWSGAWSSWATYGSPFVSSGADGVRHVEYASTDLLGNAEAVHNESLVLDATPPTTTLSPGSGPYTADTTFTLCATDAGSGVNATELRVDGGPWSPYAGGFTLAVGDHTISYRSTDHLGNREAERTLDLTVEGTPPPIPGETNWKPLVAAAFAAILALAGAWSARRAPWPAESHRRLRAFAFTAMPFVLGEVTTGVVSLFTGLLAIPPLLGAGTAVDFGLLVAGAAFSIYRVHKWTPPM